MTKTWTAKIVARDAALHRVYGWLYVCETADGQRVVDHSGEWMTPEELSLAAERFMLGSRAMSADHARDCPACGWTGDAPAAGPEGLCPSCGEPVRVVQFGTLIECVCFTRERAAAMGITCPMPVGIWVGFRVDDPAVWARVQSGELAAFSFGALLRHRKAGDGN